MDIQAACTIVSKNYLAFARVLARSFLEHHPEARFFTLIVDRLAGEFDPAREEFTVVLVEELSGIADLPSFLFKYSQLEANTAAKPYFLEHLFEKHGLENLLYLDPDIQVFQRFEALAPVLERHSIALVPHITAPIDDEHKPTEVDILLAGSFNLGFLGLRNTDTTLRFLGWWQSRLYDRCIVAHERGLFVDQKWIDLVPGIFKDVIVLTEPGYDVAYWNLHERKVTLGPPPRVNGEPLYFYHYSGIGIDDLERVSKHQTRFLLSDLGELGDLFRSYRDLLLAAGHRTCSRWPYAFASFDDGRPITDAVRRHYLELGPRRARFGDPFRSAGEDSFLASLPQPGRVESAPRPVGPTTNGPRGWVFQRLGGVYRSSPGRAARRFARRILGPERTLEMWKLGQDLRRRALGGATGAVAPPPRRGLASGIDVTGYLRAETSVGETCRSLVRALRTRGIALGLRNLDLNVRSRSNDMSLGELSVDPAHGIHLLYVNADQVGQVVAHLGPAPFAGRYNVGYWSWELAIFPEEWLPAFEPFDEIWTPSTFCVDALSAVAPIPVRRIPHAVDVASPARFGREHFGIPARAFTFLFAFDFLSLWERKNPIGAIRAFRAAFRSGEDVHLVLKSANSDSDPAGRKTIARELEGLAVTWIDRTLDRAELDDLFRACDCYVSLHRSEGFGMTLAEAMCLGKPVIATAYSGNVDFFGINNGWPVEYRLVELAHDVGPYRAGNRWAEPDVDHAAHQMRRVFEDPAERARRAERGRAEVQEQLSLEAVGALVERRLQDIERRLAARRPG